MSDRRPLRSPSTAVPIFRIVSLLFMLAVIGLTIYNLHQRASVASFAPEGATLRHRGGRRRLPGKRRPLSGTALPAISSVPFRRGSREEAKADRR